MLISGNKHDASRLSNNLHTAILLHSQDHWQRLRTCEQHIIPQAQSDGTAYPCEPLFADIQHELFRRWKLAGRGKMPNSIHYDLDAVPKQQRPLIQSCRSTTEIAGSGKRSAETGIKDIPRYHKIF